MGPPRLWPIRTARSTLRVAHHGFDRAGEELDGIGAMRFVAQAVTRQINQQRAAIGFGVERFLAAPEGEITSPAMDEYQRFGSRAVALVVDAQAVERVRSGISSATAADWR